MMSHDAKVCRRSCPSEVLDFRYLERGLKRVLDVLDRFARLAARLHAETRRDSREAAD
jgi:hypothetical protein